MFDPNSPKSGTNLTIIISVRLAHFVTWPFIRFKINGQKDLKTVLEFITQKFRTGSYLGEFMVQLFILQMKKLNS